MIIYQVKVANWIQCTFRLIYRTRRLYILVGNVLIEAVHVISFPLVTSADKRPTRSRPGRSAGVGTASSKTLTAAPGVSPPFYLGPIAEQQSMEEREEMELKRQPPSPLQNFIDSIRHSAKAKHAPIYYGTKDLGSGVSGSSSYTTISSFLLPSFLLKLGTR